MFDELKKITARASKLDINEVLYEIWQGEDVQELIIELNTRAQLYEQGIDSKEKDLGEYAPFTIEQKKIAGLPFDRITLFQTGEFYTSFYVRPRVDGFEIVANPVKENGDLFDDFGEDIVGLTQSSLEQLSKTVLTYIILQVEKRLTT